MFILTLIDGTSYLLTEEQKNKIAEVLQSPEVKSVTVLGQIILVHQITGIRNFELYRQQMKTNLQSKGKKMCRRCGMIIPTIDRCPCVDTPDKFPDLLEHARSYNPELAKQLDAIANQKQLPPPTNEEN